MKSWLLGYCKLMGKCRHISEDCSLCWSTGQASALILHFWLPSPPPHDSLLKCYPLNSLLSRESPSSPLFTPIKASSSPYLVLLSYFTSSMAMLAISSFFSTVSIPLTPPGQQKILLCLLPSCLYDPQVFPPLLCISAPRCGSPPTLHGRAFAVTSGSQSLLMPQTDNTSTEQRANQLVSSHYSIFLLFHDFSSKLRGFCPPTMLQLPPSRFTARIWTLHQHCSTAQISTPLNTIKPCQLLLLPLLLPWHACACSSQGGSLELATGLFGGLPACWMCQPLQQLHPTPTDALCSSNWPPWNVFCLCLQSTDVQKANPTDQALESKVGHSELFEFKL